MRSGALARRRAMVRGKERRLVALAFGVWILAAAVVAGLTDRPHPSSAIFEVHALDAKRREVQRCTYMGRLLRACPAGGAPAVFASLGNGRRGACLHGGPEARKRGPAAGKRAALTFDDGPGHFTPRVLSILRRARARATFFVVGSQVQDRGMTLRRIVLSGSEIGNHSWTHANLTLPGAPAKRELEATSSLVRRETGIAPCAFRPPYGAHDPKLVRRAGSLGMATVNWSVDPGDYALPPPTAATLARRVLDDVHPGAIVLFHDAGGASRRPTVDALKRIVPSLRARGYRLVTVSELLERVPERPSQD